MGFFSSIFKFLMKFITKLISKFVAVFKNVFSKQENVATAAQTVDTIGDVIQEDGTVLEAGASSVWKGTSNFFKGLWGYLGGLGNTVTSIPGMDTVLESAATYIGPALGAAGASLVIGKTTGISTSTIMTVGLVGIGVLLLLFKRKPQSSVVYMPNPEARYV